jgi:gas vesicle protein
MKKKMKKRDKLIFGTIVGGAIGSVLGMIYAPKSGKNTRKMLKNMVTDTIQQGKELTQKHIPKKKDK